MICELQKGSIDRQSRDFSHRPKHVANNKTDKTLDVIYDLCFLSAQWKNIRLSGVSRKLDQEIKFLTYLLTYLYYGGSPSGYRTELP